MSRQGVYQEVDPSPYQDALLRAIKGRLWDWGRWTRIASLPDLDVPAPPVFRNWIPSKAWDSGWGDMGAPEERPDSINERECEATDALIMRLSLVHRTTIKRHYACDWRQQRDDVDAACRAFGDLLSTY